MSKIIALRPYQQQLIDNIRQSIKSGHNNVCAVLGCGGGKSVIQGNIARMATEQKNQVLFLVHRKELCRQIEQTFIACAVNQLPQHLRILSAGNAFRFHSDARADERGRAWRSI